MSDMDYKNDIKGGATEWDDNIKTTDIYFMRNESFALNSLHLRICKAKKQKYNLIPLLRKIKDLFLENH